MKSSFLFFALFFLWSCTNIELNNQPDERSSQYITVLGIAQDAGFPQAGCEKENCRLFWEGQEEARYATSLGLVDAEEKKAWLFEATPDFKHQHKSLFEESSLNDLSGIFLTHAHIGHYTGLMHLGHEAMGASEVPVYTMPEMKNYLETNGPWSQLVEFENIKLKELSADSTIQVSEKLWITPFLVPHRDEFSETVGYRIESENKKVLFIPDINKWGVWERSIIEEISKVDIALLDGTFYDANELPGRNMADIPHPFIEESLELFKDLGDSEKEKITFIHFNHTNPLILDSEERKFVESLGFRVAYEGMQIEL